MRLISRSVLREIWPPFALGFAAYTFLLLVRQIFLMTDFLVRREATFPEVLRLIVLSVPWIVVLTIPMAYLLGLLIGIGRLSADSELVAMRSCGVGPWAVYKPAFAAAGALCVGVFVIYNYALPAANDALAQALARLAATSAVNLAQPRVFRELRPGVPLERQIQQGGSWFTSSLRRCGGFGFHARDGLADLGFSHGSVLPSR